MQNIVDVLDQKFERAIASLFDKELEFSWAKPHITQATQIQFGHYQCNSALKIGKELKQNPKDVAAKIIAAVDPLSSPGVSMIARMDIAGPGFINIILASSFLSDQVNLLLADERLGVSLPQKKERVIVEFSSPNVAKELHVGHLRSTIIGDAIARLFEFLGHDVLRLNHIGDWGTQFGMLITYIKEYVPSSNEQPNLSQLMQWYRASKQLFDQDPDFKKRSQLQVVQLQGGNPEALKFWKEICQISREAFQEIYDLLDINIQERGESFYNPYLAEVVEELDKKGLITISDGAKCIFLEGFTNRDGSILPMIVQKSDGGYNYDTTDMAAVRYRVQVDRADRIIYLTDAGQSQHFSMVFKACEKAGYVDPLKVRLHHVPFGVVLGPDGKKFKTRSGETEKLIDLLLEATERASSVMRERLPGLSEEELTHLGCVLGMDALKYADLSCNRIKDYVFSYDKMLKFEGNTAAFLLYSYVRIGGIKRKVGKDLSSLMHQSKIVIEHEMEIELALHLRQFGETLEMMSRDLLPNRLCDYLYLLAEKFNAFFRDCRVEGSEYEDSRLLLCEAASRVLEKGLLLLGLKTLPRM